MAVVPAPRLGGANLPAAGAFEAFRSTFVRFHLWHDSTLLLVRFFNDYVVVTDHGFDVFVRPVR